MTYTTRYQVLTAEGLAPVQEHEHASLRSALRGMDTVLNDGGSCTLYADGRPVLCGTLHGLLDAWDRYHARRPQVWEEA